MVTPPFVQHLRALRVSGKCAAHTSSDAHHSCFDEAALRRVAKAYNARHPRDPPIPLDGVDAASLHGELSRRLFSDCRDDPLCWLERLRLTEEGKLRGALKARAGPGWDRDANTWLTDDDIRDGMAMYSRDSFHFLGVFTIDFDRRTRGGRCIGDFMCALDVRGLIRSGVTKFAAVFNTDDSSGPGEHWIAVYACADPDNPNYGVAFYDSTGTPGGLSQVPVSIRRFMKHVAAGIGGGHPPLRWCPRAQQQGDGQCGMFCIVFLAAMLHDEPFDDFCADRSLTDSAMRDLRRVFFTGARSSGSAQAGARSARRSHARSR